MTDPRDSSGPIDEPGDGNTPLDADEAEGLLPTHLETRAQLNEWEQANIADAVRWLGARRRKNPVLSLEFTRELHRRMFDQTWSWAGTFRKTGKTIGIAPTQIAEQLSNLLADTEHRLGRPSRDLKEIAGRFHHRLAWIHPFPNGNGRHARLMTDALMMDQGVPRFSWGAGQPWGAGETRSRYINALRSADQGDLRPLLEFLSH